jgi:hypothetical protein
MMLYGRSGPDNGAGADLGSLSGIGPSAEGAMGAENGAGAGTGVPSGKGPSAELEA